MEVQTSGGWSRCDCDWYGRFASDYVVIWYAVEVGTACGLEGDLGRHGSALQLMGITVGFDDEARSRPFFP